jgi:hypothetical protein
MGNSKSKPIIKMFGLPNFSDLLATPSYKRHRRTLNSSLTTTAATSVLGTVKVGKENPTYYFLDNSRVIYITKQHADCLRLSSYLPVQTVASMLGISERNVETYLKGLFTQQ